MRLPDNHWQLAANFLPYLYVCMCVWVLWIWVVFWPALDGLLLAFAWLSLAVIGLIDCWIPALVINKPAP